MKDELQIPRLPRWLNLGLLAATTAFLMLRFIHIEANFLLGMTWSGVLYTDKGWYANPAIRHVAFGGWYQTSDFNPAVNVPLGHVMQLLVFGIFGQSLFSARLLSTPSFTATILLTALFVKGV